MKLIITITTFFLLFNFNTMAKDDDCSKYDKLSKEYAKCNTLLLKKKSIELKVKASKKSDEIKDIASKELINAKKKINKSDLKKKLLKFKNSKSYKEYKEKLNEFWRQYQKT